MPKKISAGLIYTNGKSLLLGHTTHQTHWDLPKGKVEPGETSLEACVRETREETGLEVDPEALVPLGQFRYNRRKDLELFLLRGEQPDLETLRCSTLVSGRSYPELDRFEWVPFPRLGDYVVPNMHRVLWEVFDVLERV